MRTFSLLIIAFSFSSLPLSGAEPGVAFLKSGHVFVADSEGANLRQLDDDPRPKGKLLWDGVRKRLSYWVAGTNGEKTRLVVIDLSGKRVAEVAVRPVTNPPTSGLRFVEDLEWLPDGKIRAGGSINPSNCEQFDLDINSGRESNWQFGECDTFVQSPDRKHIAELGPINQGAVEEERYDTVLLDGKGALQGVPLYTGDSDEPIFVLAGPSWAPDSTRLAIVEKRAMSSEIAVTILTLDGKVTRVPLPASGADYSNVSWEGNKVIAGEGDSALEIEPESRSLNRLTSETANRVSQSRRAREESDRAEERARSVVSRLGGTEAVPLN